jgi:hypothetical protein
VKITQKSNTRSNLDYLFPGNGARKRGLLTVYNRIKLQVDLQADKSPVVVKGRDGFGLDTHGYEFGCHYLPHFISNSDTNTNIVEYEYKTDISNLDSHSNTYSIYSRVIISINFICRWFYN